MGCDNQIKRLAVVLLLIAGPALGLTPEAGFVIKDAPVVSYQGNISVFKSSPIQIKEIHGIEVSPVRIEEKARPGETVVFCHKLENIGNASTRVFLKVLSAPPGSQVKFMLGKNEITGSLPLPENAKINLWVLFKPPPGVTRGKTYATEFSVACQDRDGDAYVGFDGQIYGGKDEITITDRVNL